MAKYVMLPVSEETRQQIRDLKGDKTYDQLISEWVAHVENLEQNEIVISR